MAEARKVEVVTKAVHLDMTEHEARVVSEALTRVAAECLLSIPGERVAMDINRAIKAALEE